MSRTNYGQVDLKINGQEYTLTPTLKAMDKIQSRWPNGVRGAIDACSDFNPRHLAFIVQVGSGMGQREATDLAEDVFKEGAVNVSAPVIEYLAMLINPTGKDLEEPEEGAEEGE